MVDEKDTDPFAVPDATEGSEAPAVTSPHDRFVRALLSNPDRAARLLREHLPREIVARLGDTPPVAVEGSFISARLRMSQSDKLFRVTLRCGTPAFLYALVEHKSYPDPGLPLQLARYQIDIWDAHAEGRAARLRALPPIIPVVLYHGAARWNVPTALYDMIAGDADLRAFAKGFSYHLRDLGHIAPEDLSSDAELRAGLMALVYAFRGTDAGEVLVSLLAAMRDGSVLESQLVRYIYATYDIAPDTLTQAARRAKPERWEALVGSLADTLIKRGKAEGIAVGKAEGLAAGEALGKAKGLAAGEALGEAKGLAAGKAEGLAAGEALGKADTLRTFLIRRFGPLPADVRARIDAADLDQLDAWLDRLLDAPTLEAVFGPDTSQ